MSHILEVSHQQAIQGLAAKGWSVRHIARTLGINRRTVQRYAGAVAPKCTTEVTTGPEIPPDSKCTTKVTTGPRSLCGGLRGVIVPMLELGLPGPRLTDTGFWGECVNKQLWTIAASALAGGLVVAAATQGAARWC